MKEEEETEVEALSVDADNEKENEGAGEFNVPKEEKPDSDSDAFKFTISNGYKNYCFKANMTGEPTVDDWINHLMQVYDAHKNTIISATRYLSDLPERHAVIPATEKLIFFKKPKGIF